AGAAQVAVGDIDLVLVPGLVFDAGGGRIGRGAAYFDGLLPGLRPGVPVVGVVPSACVVERVPMEPHDVSVTHLATEKGV
ncbi:MAG: 5-formyltetrahydrofolate cyclo-ligase, partial [Actinobacteria bacterium]|nr:5-formyltetrahydrofolate cyclo-ligase [Actinomycetota bacterium]NIS29783.1 5-formyltetrahydrofolate cyclo-ligase [Actinomycetota bacterium]NIU18338.1 5-formyltetrahydrofolate cyclo-ligase [Actinomycetota bacterium]NIU65090.1 5-formyltetrahydrofolate cyclo-ligase [Actinomycetota bacterium]NIV54830.1 5-formyltetrahydrofolate cyclo-ligase [Actinomycetota bacterium]